MPLKVLDHGNYTYIFQAVSLYDVFHIKVIPESKEDIVLHHFTVLYCKKKGQSLSQLSANARGNSSDFIHLMSNNTFYRYISYIWILMFLKISTLLDDKGKERFFVFYVRKGRNITGNLPLQSLFACTVCVFLS